MHPKTWVRWLCRARGTFGHGPHSLCGIPHATPSRGGTFRWQGPLGWEADVAGGVAATPPATAWNRDKFGLPMFENVQHCSPRLTNWLWQPLHSIRKPSPRGVRL
jgi:hypothetical protein